ncbi:hypothetical protein B0T20DRAFT_414772 [Sordaria brevicollis]|uniref:Uncharacterized protein n=1 Tax=Sordaria brevicollis TaxID=83679 RepID=A0AAE0UAZ1_SORBR|nr:hypothetical protein B0T20DRAFT_414772 [Sordaria brevicollis]
MQRSHLALVAVVVDDVLGDCLLSGTLGGMSDTLRKPCEITLCKFEAKTAVRVGKKPFGLVIASPTPDLVSAHGE